MDERELPQSKVALSEPQGSTARCRFRGLILPVSFPAKTGHFFLDFFFTVWNRDRIS
jgi:hypothetical protein